MNNNKDFVSHEVHLPSDPSINILNQNNKHKQSLKKQRRPKDKKSYFKITLWVLGLIALNITFQLINYSNYSDFKFDWGGCISVSIAYCIFSLIISAFSDIKKNPKKYEAINKAKNEAKQKQIDELKRKTEEDKQTNLPKCPTCGSTNIRRISSTERGVNVVIFGFFGNKRKCQFECLNPNCRYRW